MKTSKYFAKNQRGVMLLEALISILIFSIGILAIVALQATSVKLASDSKYRSDASLLANELIGEMWLANSSPTFAADFQTKGPKYNVWLKSSVVAALPITSDPAVTVAPIASSSPSSAVTISIYWTIPGETGKTPTTHEYSTSTQITN